MLYLKFGIYINEATATAANALFKYIRHINKSVWGGRIDKTSWAFALDWISSYRKIIRSKCLLLIDITRCVFVFVEIVAKKETNKKKIHIHYFEHVLLNASFFVLRWCSLFHFPLLIRPLRSLTIVGSFFLLHIVHTYMLFIINIGMRVFVLFFFSLHSGHFVHCRYSEHAHRCIQSHTLSQILLCILRTHPISYAHLVFVRCFSLSLSHSKFYQEHRTSMKENDE